MEIEERALLVEIKDLYDKLKQNMYGVYSAGTKIGGPGFAYELHAKEMSKKVHKLYFSFHPNYLDESNMADFMKTIDKEVSYVESLYLESLNPHATRKVKEKVCEAITKANKRIKSDLFNLFKEIDKL